ncbi:hypothetical protein SmJEL517_g04157 [Synchytrium microbalum]|uniref:Mitochondrial carrier protein n=1 Tax=Synchytrium microbalum TaxID=1806994 RepID=A0A507BZE8_9FUNG|nr:uncharacterized protein SmJEL517_g04157 [Synchytrium microbalum]TPX32802.1 hypothetical protein SmJEL517_g04157 [Synchytrium microbalum]
MADEQSSYIPGLIFSSVAALATRAVTHPLDTIKVLIQSDSLILRTQSFRSLYRGLPVSAFFSIPALSLYLHAYDSCKTELGDLMGDGGSDSVYVHGSSAVVAEGLSAVFWTPMEVLKNRQQVSSRNLQQESNIFRMVKEVYHGEGIRGFFKGYLLNLAVFVPYTVTYFVTYEQLKLVASGRTRLPFSTAQEPESETVELNFASYAASSAAAGAVAGAISNVLDVVKTRVQISRVDGVSATSVIRNIYATEGLAGFARGMTARIIWITPSVVISMSVYEVLKDWWRNREQSQNGI